jgi:putrescine transport system ATP-binding protein
MAALVTFQHITKRFGDFTALDGVTLDIHAGEFFALLGPSGCGKTTLLRLLAGFENPDDGRVILDGEDLAGVPPYRRPVNMMFQSYALFPHMTVAGNVAFGLKQDGLPKTEIAARVDEMLALVQMTSFAARKPDQLSGGQRQRVALARSLAKRPKVLLLDEPLAALDRKLREETRFELKALQKKLATTFVIVTHDQDEAMTVADRIGVMDHGRLVQVGTPAEVYQRPATRWVAGFVGDVNFITAPGGSGVLALRPEKVRIAHAAPEGRANGASGVVSEIGYLGATSLYKVRLDDGAVLKAAVMNGEAVSAIHINDRVWVSWPADAAVLLTE